MAIYDYTIYNPLSQTNDYVDKFSDFFTDLSGDITTESDRLDVSKAITDLITISSPLNLNTMDTNITTNANAISTTNNVSANNVLLGNDNGAGQDFQELTANEVIVILNAGTGLQADTSAAITTTTGTSDTTMYPVLAPTDATASQSVYTDAGIEYNASTNTLSTKSTPHYGLVVLDRPQELLSSGTFSGSWTQFDMSEAGGAAATAASAGATKAILKCYIIVSTGDSAGDSAAIYFQKNGLAAPTDYYAHLGTWAHWNNNSGYSAVGTAEIIVNLDTNSDFEYYANASPGAGGTFRVHLVGYYV